MNSDTPEVMPVSKPKSRPPMAQTTADAYTNLLYPPADPGEEGKGREEYWDTMGSFP